MSTVSYRDFTGTAAENYQRYFVPAIATPVSAGLFETARLQPGERVLDVACGTGVVARLAAEAVGSTGSVTGIDLAPDMIDVARATRAPAEPPIDWHIGDAASLPFPDNTYDSVLSCRNWILRPSRTAVAVAGYRRRRAFGLASGIRLTMWPGCPAACGCRASRTLSWDIGRRR